MGRSRRDFLKKSVGLVSLATVAPHVWLQSAVAQTGGGSTNRVLVVLQLTGGNDGIQTIVPYGQGAYYDARPNIAIPEGELIDIDGSVGFNPSLAALMPFYEANKLAVVQGVGYPQPNRSHFRSMDIWHTAEPIDLESIGWLGRYADMHLETKGELAAINIGGSLPKSLNAERVVVPSIANLQAYDFRTDPNFPGDRTNQVNTFLSCNDRPTATGDEAAIAKTGTSAYHGSSDLQASVGGYTPRATYPESALGRDLQFAAQIITAGIGTSIIYVSTGGYDNHANEINEHPVLLTRLAEGLAAFQNDIEGQGLADRVGVLVFSEFGRRVAENGSDGTDHGTSSVMFSLGNGVNGGLYGQYPSLTSLDGNGDLIFTVDFRNVYADALENWLGVPSQEILDGTFSPMGIFQG